jgi:predicted nucleic acid-binding protein
MWRCCGYYPIAALAQALNCKILTFDGDFRAFEDLKLNLFVP